MSVYAGPREITNGLVGYWDAKNFKSYTPNVHPYPTDLYSWVTTGNACTLSRDNIISPVGSSPLKMTVTGSDPFTSSYNGSQWNLAAANSGQVWTISAWAKANTATTAEFLIFEVNSSGTYLAAQNQGIVLSTDWQRFSTTKTLANNSTAYIQVRLDGTPLSGAGIDIWWDGLQVERGSVANDFSPTRNSASGNNWNDLTSNSSSTLMYIPTYSSNGYITFNGTNQYAYAGDLPAFDFGTGSATIDMWIRSQGTYSDSITRRIVSKGASADGAGGEGFAITIYSSIYATVNTSGSVSRLSTVLGDTIYNTVGEWMNITFVLDRSDATMKLYKNAGRDGMNYQTSVGTGSISSAAAFLIGGLGATNSFNGDIAVVKGYNRALSVEEITSNFNALRGRFGI